MQDAAQQDYLPPSMATDWTELALPAIAGTGEQPAMYVFLLAVVLVFLVLAAQYRGAWSLPLAVILVVPMCLLCSIAGLWIAHQDINIFTQIGFIVLVGLACKNAILIVEFAKSAREEGADRKQATLDAVRSSPATADHDDVVRVHPGRGAAGDLAVGAGASRCSGRWSTAVFAKECWA